MEKKSCACNRGLKVIDTWTITEATGVDKVTRTSCQNIPTVLGGTKGKLSTKELKLDGDIRG